MGYVILTALVIYYFFVPWQIKKKITLVLLLIGIILFIYPWFLPSSKSNSRIIAYGLGLIVFHFITIMTSRGAWADSKGIDGYNTSKRLIAGECPYCNKRISRTAKVCPHCTTELF